MRWSELTERECIDMMEGERLGTLAHADMVINPRNGKIQSISMPKNSSWLRRGTNDIHIPWYMVKRIGPKVMIIDTAFRK